MYKLCSPCVTFHSAFDASLGDRLRHIPPSAHSRSSYYITFGFSFLGVSTDRAFKLSCQQARSVSQSSQHYEREIYLVEEKQKNVHGAETWACGAQSCETQHISLSKWMK